MDMNEEDYHRVVTNMQTRINELEQKNEAFMKTLVKKEQEIVELKEKIKSLSGENQ